MKKTLSGSTPRHRPLKSQRKASAPSFRKNSRLRDAIIMEFHALETCRKTKRIPLDAVKARLRAVARRMLATK